jgi:hypothetical protein
MNPDGKQAFPKTGKRIRKGSAKALFDWIWRKVPNWNAIWEVPI